MLNYLNLIHDFVHICHPWIMLIWSLLWPTLHYQAIILLQFTVLIHVHCFAWEWISSIAMFILCNFVDWNCFQVGPQFVLDFSEFDSFCSSCFNGSRLSRIFFTLFFHWRPTLRMDDSSNSMHTRSLCNGVNNFYFMFFLFIYLLIILGPVFICNFVGIVFCKTRCWHYSYAKVITIIIMQNKLSMWLLGV